MHNTHDISQYSDSDSKINSSDSNAKINCSDSIAKIDCSDSIAKIIYTGVGNTKKISDYEASVLIDLAANTLN